MNKFYSLCAVASTCFSDNDYNKFQEICYNSKLRGFPVVHNFDKSYNDEGLFIIWHKGKGTAKWVQFGCLTCCHTTKMFNPCDGTSDARIVFLDVFGDHIAKLSNGRPGQGALPAASSSIPPPPPTTSAPAALGPPATSASTALGPPAPPRWRQHQEHTDKQSKPYYYDHANKQSTYDASGWIEQEFKILKDRSSGQFYYCNKSTKMTQWEAPGKFLSKSPEYLWAKSQQEKYDPKPLEDMPLVERLVDPSKEKTDAARFLDEPEAEVGPRTSTRTAPTPPPRGGPKSQCSFREAWTAGRSSFDDDEWEC